MQLSAFKLGYGARFRSGFGSAGVLAVGACVAAVGLWTSGAVASPRRWSPPVRLSPEGQVAEYPQLGVDGRGDAVAVWFTSVAPPAYGHVMVSRWRAVGAAWTRPVRLSSADVFGGFPAVAVDPGGAAVAVWQNGGMSSTGRPSPPSIYASFERSQGAPWSRPRRISAAGAFAATPAVAIDRRGAAVAVWEGQRGRWRVIEASTLDVGHGAWSAPAVLARSAQYLVDPQVAISPRGEAVVVWERYVSGSPLTGEGVRYRIGAAVRPARGRWLKAADLGSEEQPPPQGSANVEAPGPHVAVDGAGDAVVVWQGGSVRHVFTTAAVWNARRRVWRGPAAVSREWALLPQVAVDARGDVTVVWRGVGGHLDAVEGQLPFVHWSRPQTVSHQTAYYPTVVMDRFGDALAGWGGVHVQAALRRGLRGRWQAPVDVGPGRSGPVELAFDRLGGALAVWQHAVQRPRGLVIEAASYGPNAGRRRQRPAGRG